MSAAARERFMRKVEAEDLRRAFDRLDVKGDVKIDAEELNQVFTQLGCKMKKAEIEDMIWEVDEDCDKGVSWAEFQQMYHRCRNDKTGYEPRRLYNVVEFLMNDKDDSGAVSVEEAMSVLYVRHGKTNLDEHLTELFGHSDINSEKDLTLSEFLHALNVIQVKVLLRNKANTKNYRPPAPGKKSGVKR